MKTLASDFDGTLYFEDSFKEEDIKKIKEFQEKGHLFGICSGRPFKGLSQHCQNQIDFDFYILCTGALVLNKQLDVIYKSTITKDLLKRIYKRYQKDYEIFIQANYQIYTFFENTAEEIDRTVVHSFDEIEGDIYGISINGKTNDLARQLCLDIEKTFPDLTAHQNKQYIDVTKKGTSKGKGIEELKKVLSLHTIAGIGDSYNDLSMLETVDHPFTFPQSPQELKDIATVVETVAEAIDILMKE